MQRVSVVGTTGSGKSTLARSLAERLSLTCIELDALHWDPNWQQATADELRERLERAIEAAPAGWVIDGNYSGKLGTFVLERADMLVWLDMPLHVCLRRLWRRTWSRVIRREELWAGNRESLRTAFLDRDSIFLWALKTHGRRRRQYPELLARFPELESVRLREPRAVERWLAGVPARD